MWLCLNDAYLSFVSKDCKPSELLVRARRPGDIERIFPKATVTEYDKSDYQFRAVVTRNDVKAALAGEVDRIVYNNFKNSVRDHDLHSAYNSVWGIMAKLQPKAPYSGFNRAKGALKGFDDLFMDDFGAQALPTPKKKPDAQVRKNLKKLARGQ
jgi:hypothetical protein